MSQKIKTTELKSQLESVAAGIASKELIEQTSCFIFSKKRIITFNDMIAATVPTTLKINGVVQSEPILKLISKVKDEEIEVVQKEGKLLISGKRFNAEFNMTKSMEIPLGEIDIPDSFIETPPEIQSCLKMACFTASKSLAEPLLRCVHIKNNKVESCNNDQITICTLPKKFKGIDVLVPAKNVSEINKQKIVGIAVVDGWAHFNTENGAILSSKTLQQKYLDLSQYIPNEDSASVIEFPSQIKEILDRAEILSSVEEDKSVDKIIRISLSKEKLIIESENAVGKYTEERRKVKYDGDPIEFETNPDFLRHILSMTNVVSLVEDTIMFKEPGAIHLIKLIT